MNKIISKILIINLLLINSLPLCAQEIVTDDAQVVENSKQAIEATAEEQAGQVNNAVSEIEDVAAKEKNRFLFFAKKEKLSEDEKRKKKTFEFFKKKEKTQTELDLKAKKEEQKLVREAQKQLKKEKKAEQKEKKEATKKQKEDKYAQYRIPTDGYMPVGDEFDKAITISGGIQKTLEFNLADCLELALINNPKVKSAYANAESFKYKKGQTLSNYSPKVDIMGGISRIKPDMSTFKSRGITIDPFTKYTMGSIGISQLVYDFGITQNQYTIDKLQWENSKANIDSVVNSVVCQVKDGYYNLIYALEAKNVAQETLEQFEAMLAQAEAFYQVGTKPKVDVTIAQVNAQDARAKFINASNNVDIAVSNLNNAMGLPFVPPYVIDTSSPYEEVDISMKKAIEIANESRPDLKTVKLSVQTAEQAVKLAWKTYFPKLEFQANWSIGGVDSFTDTKWWDVGGFLSFPTINPFLIRNQIKDAKAQLEKQKYDSTSVVNDVYYDIQSTYVKLVDAKQRVPVAELAVKQAKENYDLSQGRYRVGVGDAIEFKEAQIQYYNARLNHLGAIYQYNSAKANLERAIGQTLATVKSENNEGI